MIGIAGSGVDVRGSEMPFSDVGVTCCGASCSRLLVNLALECSSMSR